jgi:hypothetical protein
MSLPKSGPGPRPSQAIAADLEAICHRPSGVDVVIFVAVGPEVPAACVAVAVGVEVVPRRAPPRHAAARERVRRSLGAGARRATTRGAPPAALGRSRGSARHGRTALGSGGGDPLRIHVARGGRHRRDPLAVVRPPAQRRPCVVRARRRTPPRWRSRVAPGTEQLSAAAHDRRAVARSSG